MSVRNLEHLFNPSSIAVVGASNNRGSLGYVVMRNLLQGGFEGPILPVNPKHKAVTGVLAYSDVEKLPQIADLAIICTPPPVIPELVATLGRQGTKAVIILTAGVRSTTPGGDDLLSRSLQAARPHNLRILGPNCLGLIVPRHGLNASFAHLPASPGRLAFVSQSGALCTAVLDWANDRAIGFSHFISLGDQGDVDFGDVLDFLGSDRDVRGILLYIEAIDEARKFMSAARAAARNKPVLVVKAGRQEEGAAAATSHTGALAGQDDVYDAAIRRAGMLRVYDIDELFDSVETLARARPVYGDRLAILTNGGGPGVLAVDALVSAGGRLAELGEETISQLDKFLPEAWSRGNPVDIIGDADGERYRRAVEILLADDHHDALLVMNVPTALTSSDEAAGGVIPALQRARKAVLTSWLGGQTAETARQRFTEISIPTYETPAHAIEGFLQLVRYRRNQDLLMETPPSVPAEFTPDISAATEVIRRALAENREWLSDSEARAILTAYDIPVVESQFVSNSDDAVKQAEQVGFPVALKIVSRQILHKSDVGGVALNLESGTAVYGAAEAMRKRVSERAPDAEIAGYLIQPMALRRGAHELLVGVKSDRVFGPVIVFGQGGTAVEVIGDRAVALPPLNMNLAAELVDRTRVAKLLRGYRDRAAIDFAALHLVLVKVSQMIVDLPQLTELDINPLYADAEGVLALDVRLRVAKTEEGLERLAIRPYPAELEEVARLPSGERVLLRPIRPEDEPAHQEFFERLSPNDIYFRFFGLVRRFPHSQMARFTQIDYDREMALIAQIEEAGKPRTVGVVRTVSDPDKTCAEFAVIVRSDLKGHGLGHVLMDKIICYCRDQGIQTLTGQVFTKNAAMLQLAHSMGFTQRDHPEPGIVEVALDLRHVPADDSPRILA